LNFYEQQWLNVQLPPELNEVVIFVHIDGSFSIFDPDLLLSVKYWKHNF
jgi:hypothetical protein